MAPKISVLMGVYNAESTILRALDSLIGQTYRNWEAIIVNDGSTDSSPDLLEEFARRDSRIRIIHQKHNCGLPVALNLALSNAKGEYIARQDADDFSYRNRFELQLQMLEKRPDIAVLGAWMDLVDETGEVWGKVKHPNCPSIRDWVRGPAIAHGTIMARTSAFREAGGYDPSLRRGQDYDLWLRMLASDFRFANIEQELYAYQVTPTDFRRRKVLSSPLSEMKIRYSGFKRLGLGITSYPYVFKPLFSRLIPSNMIAMLHKRKYNAK